MNHYRNYVRKYTFWGFSELSLLFLTLMVACQQNPEKREKYIFTHYCPVKKCKKSYNTLQKTGVAILFAFKRAELYE